MAEPTDDPRDRPWDRGGRDDRPRRDRDRDRDRDDDYDDDRPRRRRRPPENAGKSAGVVIAIIVGVVLACGLLLGVLVMLLLPAVQRVREAASRQKDQNSLKQIGLAVNNHHDATGAFPAAQDGVSWRVHILPYLEQDNVYRRMDVTQPWDAPVNRPYASVKISQYTSTADPPETTETRWRVFVGPNTLYPKPGQRTGIADIPDGSANTIFAVEAAELVPWPQPKELPYDRGGPLPPLGGPGRRGFNVLMADASVRFVSDRVSPEIIRGGIDPADGRFFHPDD